MQVTVTELSAPAGHQPRPAANRHAGIERPRLAVPVASATGTTARAARQPFIVLLWAVRSVLRHASCIASTASASRTREPPLAAGVELEKVANEDTCARAFVRLLAAMVGGGVERARARGGRPLQLRGRRRPDGAEARERASRRA